MPKIKSLCLCINAFDASELLETLITEIRDEVDWVIALYQNESYCGNKADQEDLEELWRLKNIGLIDELIEFKGDKSKPHREQETDKRNYGIMLARERGHSHFLSIDSDEFYNKDQFREAKKQINENGWNVTYWSYVNYYKDFEHYLMYPFKPYVTGICSTYFTFLFNGPAPGPTDPTRRINNPYNIGMYVFPDDVILMAHASWIRKDIRKKLENWSAKSYFNKELLDKAVKRWYEWKEGDNAIMLFNTPNNEVTVKKLNKPIHNFKIPWA